MNDDMESVKYLIEVLDVSVEKVRPTPQKNRPLHLAAGNNKLELVKYFVSKGADIDSENEYGYTALIQASVEGYTDIVKFLLDNGANVDAADNQGYTSLMVACLEQRIECAHILIQAGANVNATTLNGATAIVLAALSKNVELCQYLIQNGADVNASEEGKLSNLYHAGSTNDIDILNLLIQQGLKIDLSSEKDNVQLLNLIYQKYFTIPEYLLSNTNQKPDIKYLKTYLATASSSGSLSIVNLMIEKFGVPVDDQLQGKFTALQQAVMDEQVEIIEYLLSKGANIDAVILENGATSLYAAVDTKKIKSAKLLIEKGANIHVTTRSGKTLLHRAAKNGSAGMIRFLLQYDLDIEAKDKKGRTPFLTALENQKVKAAQELIKHGADTLGLL